MTTTRAEPRHHLHIVLDEQDRRALRIEVEHAVDDQFEQRRIDAGRRLVEQDRVGIGHQDARELQQLALTAGEHPRRLAFEPGQRHEVEQRPRLLDRRALLRRDAAGPDDVQPGALARLALPAGQHVLKHGHLGEWSRDLECAADAVGDARLGAGLAMSTPLIRMLPALGLRLPASRLKSVVLPAPFGPIRPSSSPR